MQINSVNNTQSFGMAFRPEGVERAATEFVKKAPRAAKGVVRNMMYLQERFAGDFMDLSARYVDGKIVTELSSAGGKVAGKYSVRRFLTSAPRVADEMYGKLGAALNKGASKATSKGMKKFGEDIVSDFIKSI